MNAGQKVEIVSIFVLAGEAYENGLKSALQLAKNHEMRDVDTQSIVDTVDLLFRGMDRNFQATFEALQEECETIKHNRLKVVARAA